MIFSTYNFIFIFLPIVLIGYFGLSKFASHFTQKIFLIVASLVFYGYANIFEGETRVWYIPLILTSITVNYASAFFVQNNEGSKYRKLVFTLAVIFNVLLLGYYKYRMFIMDNINIVFDTHFVFHNFFLPLGISFLTFHQIAFLICIWKKEEQVPSITDYTLFVTFFPQLVSGPIVFLQDVISQYTDDKRRFFNIENFSQGLFLFMIGLFKKVVIADSVALFANNGYDNYFMLDFGSAWITSLSYTLQIFFDFSGYSDMAIGLGKMLNIELPVNFYSPYKSKSITEFWQRWHITLGRALALLVYFPLGGNRKGLPRTCINLFIVFFISGLWHGAAWTFIIWGVLHGVVRVFEKLFEKPLDKVPTFIRVIFTFIIVNAAWVFFRAKNVEVALAVLKNMFLPNGFHFHIGGLAFDSILTYPYPVHVAFICLLVFGLYTILFFYPKNSIDMYNKFRPDTKRALLTAALFCLCMIHMSRVSPFIYFNF